jgi:F0F1-type ATP synthase assembly protein I
LSDSRPSANSQAVKLNVVARKKSFTEQAAEYSTLAFVLPAATAVGWFLGHLLDKAFGTGYLYIVPACCWESSPVSCRSSGR